MNTCPSLSITLRPTYIPKSPQRLFFFAREQNMLLYETITKRRIKYEKEND